MDRIHREGRQQHAPVFHHGSELRVFWVFQGGKSEFQGAEGVGADVAQDDRARLVPFNLMPGSTPCTALGSSAKTSEQKVSQCHLRRYTKSMDSANSYHL